MELEEVLEQVVRKITPSVAEILRTGEYGKIELHFGPKGFQLARKDVVI